MKTYAALLFTLLPMLAAAQKAFTIRADNVPFKDGDRMFLVYKEKGVQHADSTTVKGGAFAFKGTITSLGTGYISRNDNPFFAAFLYDSADIYIEPGTITITTADSLIHANINGTSTNNDATELNIALQPIQERLRPVNQYYDALTPAQQEDANIIADVRAKTNVLLKEMEPIKFAFIKAHPASYISLETLIRMLNNADIKDVSAAYAGLTSGAKNSELGRKLGGLIRAAETSSIGVMAPDFTLPDKAGNPVKLSAYRGKYVLVDFWASWCFPCRQENPNVLAAYKKYRSKGFTVLSVSIDDKRSRAAWLQAIKNDHLPWTQVVDRFKPAKMVKESYGVTTIPANVLVDPAGKIVARNIRDKVLERTLSQLFGE